MPAQQWGPEHAHEVTRKLFGALVDAPTLARLQKIAHEAVLLGYRAATPLDLEVVMGVKKDYSWVPELQALKERASECVANS